MTTRKILMTLGILLCAAGATFADVRDVSVEEQKQWTRRLLPLPHKVAIEKKVVLPIDRIAVTTGENPGKLEKNAAEQLRAALGQKTTPANAQKEFEIVLGVLDKTGAIGGVPVPEAEKLKGFPNSDQAYLTRPIGDNKLVIAALDGKGVYYGARTLIQFLTPGSSTDVVTLPLAKIDDWPDLRERGVWNGRSGDTIPWLASLKLNFDTTDIRWKRFRRGEKLSGTIDAKIRELADANAFNYCPKLTHLNFLHVFGLYEAYPELAGKGPQAFQKHNGKHGNQCPCASNPLLAKLLTEAMEDLARQGLMDVTVWTSEYLSNCQCPDCAKLGYRMGQFELEAKAIVEAWRETKKKYPDFNIRVFFSPSQFEEGNTLDDIRRMCRTLPKDVRVERACYQKNIKNAPRNRIVDAPFDELAANGYEVISYMLPPTCQEPFFKVLAYKDYFENLSRRKWVAGYAIQSYPGPVTKELFNPMLYAIAEWGWNNAGRDARDFGEAWAVREGHAAPEKIGEWFALMAPIEFDIFGSCYAPNSPVWTKYFTRELPVDRRRGHSPLGDGFYRYYPDKASFDKKIADCGKAERVAVEAGAERLAVEARLCRSFIRQSRAGDVIADAICQNDDANPKVRDKVAGALRELKESVAERAGVYAEIDKALSEDARKAFNLKGRLTADNDQLAQLESAFASRSK